jgi:hypothetical protein
MHGARGLVLRLALAGSLAVVLTVGGVVSWRTASAATRVLDRSDSRFDVLVQRRTERFVARFGARLEPPLQHPRLTAAQAFSIANGSRQPHGGKPSVRLTTFSDPEFPTPVGAGGKLRSRPVRALVWLVVVPDVPVVYFGPDFGPRGPRRRCPTFFPVDAITGKPLGMWWHHCEPFGHPGQP